MNVARLLTIAGVPAHLHPKAVACIELADERSRGLLWHKIKARFFRAGRIAKVMQWHHHRLTDARPEWADWDIAPMLNITGHGDNGPWIDTPDGGRPLQDYWLNPDPQSADYQEAVAKCYWCPGHHPRSPESRKAWYRRNGGEYEAWSRGIPVDLSNGVQVWRGDGVVVYRCGAAWQLIAQDKWLGLIPVVVRVGYEISNVWRESDGAQLWFPIPGADLRAPVTWSVLPGRA